MVVSLSPSTLRATAAMALASALTLAAPARADNPLLDDAPPKKKRNGGNCAYALGDARGAVGSKFASTH